MLEEAMQLAVVSAALAVSVETPLIAANPDILARSHSDKPQSKMRSNFDAGDARADQQDGRQRANQCGHAVNERLQQTTIFVKNTSK